MKPVVWRVLLWTVVLAIFAALPADARFAGESRQAATLQTGEGVWFYVLLLPGDNEAASGLSIASGFNRELTLDYGSISSTLGLLDLPLIGLLYEPVVYPGTFVIVNKSAVPVTVTTTVGHGQGPAGKTFGELLYLIPASQYTGAANRQPAYTFTLLPGASEPLHSVVVTGSLIRNVLGLLLFSPFPTGSYSGFALLQVQYDNGTETIAVPGTMTVY